MNNEEFNEEESFDPVFIEEVNEEEDFDFVLEVVDPNDFQNQGKFATRDQNGNLKYYHELERAIQDFLSYDGYRLDLESDDAYMFIHREELPEVVDYKPGSIGFANPSSTVFYQAKITVMMKRKF